MGANRTHPCLHLDEVSVLHPDPGRRRDLVRQVVADAGDQVGRRLGLERVDSSWLRTSGITTTTTCRCFRVVGDLRRQALHLVDLWELLQDQPLIVPWREGPLLVTQSLADAVVEGVLLLGGAPKEL